MTSLEQHLALHPITVDHFGRRCACDPQVVRHDGPYPEDEEKFYQLHNAHVADTWRESRTVRTVEELDALPNGSIYVSDAEGLAEQKAGDVWFAARCAQPFEPVLPGVVVHRPDEDGAQ